MSALVDSGNPPIHRGEQIGRSDSLLRFIFRGAARWSRLLAVWLGFWGLATTPGCNRGETSPAASESRGDQLTGPAASENRPKKVRGPAVAGLFYPKHKQDLGEELDRLLEEAKGEKIAGLRGLICPHAGYRFSGPVAAVGYSQLRGRKFNTVIVMAPSHYVRFEGASIADAEAYETPLGLVPVSAKARKLASRPPFVLEPVCADIERPPWWRQAPKELPPFGHDTPHTWEHSLEVQLPFLQRTLGRFELVPIVFGRVDPEQVAEALLEMIDEHTLLVASSDLSHYHSYELATRLDKTCVQAICSMNSDWAAQQEACGILPILTLMEIARQKGWRAKMLDCRNSGDTAGQRDRVVGYAAIAFYKPQGAEIEQPAEQLSPPPRLDDEKRAFLLRLARENIERVVRGMKPDLPPEDEVPAALREPRACFVTLTRQGRLRGCIGSIFPQEALYQSVVTRAVAAALYDRRFPPVRADELEELKIEISVLSLPRRLEFQSPEELLEKLRPGVDGVVLRIGSHQATYLPQVWEQLPDKEQFLNHLAEKAGLDASAWRDPKARVLVYQVEAFEQQHGEASSSGQDGASS